MDGSVVVFGGSGQLGQDLTRTAASSCFSFRAVLRAEADICDEGAVRALVQSLRPRAVVNAAAYTRVDDAEIEREAAERSNILGPSILGKVCAEAEIPLVHLSTDYVFDGRKPSPYTEADPVAPAGYYGFTKLKGEDAVREASARHIILRVSWLYGEFGNNFLKTMLRLGRERDKVSVVADQHGCPTSTRDVSMAILRVIENVTSADPRYGTYHFSGSGMTTWHGFASAAIGRLNDLTGRNTEVVAISTSEYPTRTRRPANSALDCSKFASTFGYRGRPWREEVEAIAEILIGKTMSGKPAARQTPANLA